ncbi:MAG: NAD-dependent succinate-semialdehyde dehydrogenase [Vicingaceae bacterium]
MISVSDKKLLKSGHFINGEWLENDLKYDVKDPASGEVIAQCSNGGKAETELAISAANAALKDWGAKAAKERSAVLKKWHRLILENIDDLAMILTREQGKPLPEAKGEIGYGASFIEWFAEEAKRNYGDVIPSFAKNKRILVVKQPVGVVAAITPWNFPNAMITRKVAPALAAGCTVVIKPSEETPLSALALVELADRAGFPKGVINMVCGTDAPTIGSALTASPLVRKLSFTGSTPVGKLLMKQCADTVKKVSLELGGNAPFIVFDDADLDAAVQGAIASKYRNAGQTCVCANRLLVQDAVYDEFAKKYSNEVSKMKVGIGTETDVLIGPLINEAAMEKVERLVEDALSKGAKAMTGGHRMEGGSRFYQPTVLTEVTDEMACSIEEIFGPVAPLYRFKTEDEAIAMANNTRAGLAAYFFSRDIGRIWRVSEALEYGMVGVNDGMISTEVAPFGGVKESGMGREGSKYGLDDFTEIKYILHGGLAS